MNRNAAVELLRANLAGDRGERIAYIDRNGSHSYRSLADRSRQFAHLLNAAGIAPGERVLLALEDTVAFPICFLGALQAGVVAVPLNTMLTAGDFAFIAEDSGAVAVVASAGLIDRMPAGLAQFGVDSDADGWRDLDAALSGQPATPIQPVSGGADIAFWLYTSGTTGKPKGVIHTHANMLATAERYGQGVLDLSDRDLVFSASKLFFAYGLGNSLTFPLAAGATVVLLDTTSRPDAVHAILNEHRPTVFFGVPTLYARLLNTGNVPRDHRIRLCISAGEALPEAILRRWQEATGIEILDGIGSTEMLHMYISNRAGDVRPGTSGTPVDGYRVKILDESGNEVPDGNMGDLYVAGPSLTTGYWNRPELNRETFDGPWMHSGDKFVRNESGAYAYCGRSDDLLKVGGIYVSPMEVENALLEHEAVAEAAVVGQADDDHLIKPKAFVVAKTTKIDEQTLIDHVAARLAAYKRPRWVEFVDQLPKTATGKIQRFKLRQ